MAKDKRDNGLGTIYCRPNGTWQAEIYLGRKEDGSPKFKYLSGKTQAEVKRKIREYNFAGSELEKRTITVGEYITNWLMVFKKGTIKESIYIYYSIKANGCQNFPAVRKPVLGCCMKSLSQGAAGCQRERLPKDLGGSPFERRPTLLL